MAEAAEELCGAALPAWFYPLRWHQTFPAAERRNMLLRTCVARVRRPPPGAPLTRPAPGAAG